MTQSMSPDELDRRLEQLARGLLEERDEAVAARAASGVERRWREDQAAFEGLDPNKSSRGSVTDYATGEAWITKEATEPRRSKVIVNIIRGKCNTAEGRFCEIMLPTDDLNFGVQPSPLPTMVQIPQRMATMQNAVNDAIGQLGAQPPAQLPQQPPPGAPAGAAQPAAQPVSQDQQADEQQRAQQELAKRRSSAMQKEIEDQLEECSFNGECRKVARSAVRLGTGVLKGPSRVKRVQRSWVAVTDGDGTEWVLEAEEKMAPASKSCDIWNLYPDANCGENPQRGSYMWERDLALPRELRALIGLPGYNKRQILAVLKEEPKRTTAQKPDKGGDQYQVSHDTATKGAPYETWERHGEIERSKLESLGIKGLPEDVDAVSACVVFANDRPIKVMLNLLESGELPYDFFQWEEVADSPWGIGEPRKLMWIQRIIIGAWRAMMDNAGDSSGAMVVMGPNIEPDDGVYEISGKKLFRALSDLDEGADFDARKEFVQYQIESNQTQLEAIIMLALRFGDLESQTPMLAQGEKGSSPETLGGMQILMQGADTGRRRQVKQWDDQITRPHISRYYHWNMQFNPKNDIKGDFEVDARGTSVLLVKDQAAQALVQLPSLRSDPEADILIDWEKVYRQLMESRHLDVLNSDEVIRQKRAERQNMPPPVAPQVQVAQVRATSAEKIKQAELAVETDNDEKDRQAKLAIAMISARLQSADLASVERQVLEKIKADLTNNYIKVRAQLQLSGQDIAHEKDLAIADHTVDLHKHATEQVLTPPTEPAGRAPAGEAFQA